jgi:hypoxanthine phosphoribosyltransferase
MLTDGISLESRTNTFQYTNILYQKTELKKILQYINRIKQTGWFEFIESKDKDEYEDKEESIDEEYILFDDWWKQFEELRNLLKEQYEKINV